MLKEEIKSLIRKNWKMLSNSIFIKSSIPKTFTFGEFLNATVEIKFHKKNFNKFLSKLGLDSLPLKVVVTYWGLGFITYYKDIDRKELDLSFFGARKAILAETGYQEISGDSSISVSFLATPYLVLPTISLIRGNKKVNYSGLTGVFVIHKYVIELYTKAEGEDILFYKVENSPNVLFPPFNKSDMYPAYHDLLDNFKKYFNRKSEDFYVDMRKNTVVLESSLGKLPLRVMIFAPYNKVELIDLKESTANTIKRLGYGNIANFVKIDVRNWEETKRNLLEVIKKISPQNTYESKMRLVIVPRGETDWKKEMILRISTGITIEKGDEIIHEDVWVVQKKFKLKEFKKRKEFNINLKIPKVGSSIIYRPDNEDIKTLYEIVEGEPKEIRSYREFDEIAKRLAKEGVIIENFKDGFSIYPHIKIEAEMDDEIIFEQIIPQIYSIDKSAPKK